jgi:hypothetical protein
MKFRQLTAIILSALLLLCSCGSATNDGGENRITRESQAEETLTDAKAAETLGETTETLIETTVSKQEDTIENANKNAELVFEKAAIHSAKLNAVGKETVDVYFDLSSMNDEFLEAAKIGSSSFEMMPEFSEDVGGVYITLNNEEGYPGAVIWASSLETNIIGIYPEEDLFGVNDLFYEVGDEYSLGEAMGYALLGFVEDSKTQNANRNAKLVFQNAATYLIKVQIVGAELDSLEYSGSLNEKSDIFPEVNFEKLSLTETDVTNALRYYMGGDGGGVYTILLDEQYNPIGALWAADEESSVVGAYPIARTVYDNQSGNINTADVHTAAAPD